MNTLPAIRPIGYSKEAVLYGYQGLQVVDMETLGRLMYPYQKDPVEAIKKVFKRNKKHFTDRDTVLLKVDATHLWNARPAGVNLSPADGQPKEVVQKREMRFFTLPYGVIKICKFSQSPLAVPVLERMIEMHEAFIKGALPRWDKSLASVARIPKWTRGRGEVIREIAEQSGVCAMTIRRHAARISNGEPITKNCPDMKRGYCHRKYKGIKEEAIRLRAGGCKAAEIAQRFNVPLATIYRWI